jgi:porin-like protein
MSRIARSLLFGCVVMVAASAAHAASPVEYVRVCSLYGEGFYYIPGTDTCLKIGGYVQSQAEYGSGSHGIVIGSGPLAPDGRFTRSTSEFAFSNRAVPTFDSRSQTPYGTLRTYVRFRIASTGISGTVSTEAFVERAFIQFAGFTFGRSQSFFDNVTFTNRYNYLDVRTAGDTAADGTNLAAYTWDLGNGVTVNFSAEEPFSHFKAGTADGNSTAFAVNGSVTTDNHGVRMPDWVGSLRINQAWGSAGISGAIHEISAGYFGSTNVTTNGYPDNKFGWAVSGGADLRLPYGDTFGVNAVYSEGAAGYATKGGSWQIYGSNSVGVGWITDGLFDTGREIERTRVWSVNAAYQHMWNQMWRTSLYGGYVDVSYNAAAKTIINSHLPGASGSIQCGVAVASTVWPPVDVTASGGVGNSCTPNFSFFQLGSRTEFTPVRGFGIGLDVFWTHLNTAYKGVGIYAANAPRPATGLLDDQNVLSAIFRVQRNISGED